MESVSASNCCAKDFHGSTAIAIKVRNNIPIFIVDKPTMLNMNDFKITILFCVISI